MFSTCACAQFDIIDNMKQLIHILFASLSILLAGCFRQQEPIQVKPASVDDISRAVFKISTGVGQGVFVGRLEGTRERVFFLTARHVVTYPGFADYSSIDIITGDEKCYDMSVDRQRWMTDPDKNCDVAWVELTDDECRRLKEKTGMAYISLDSKPDEGRSCAIQGTGTMRLCHAVRREGMVDSPAQQFFLAGRIEGVMLPKMSGPCTIHTSNKVLKTIRPWVVGATNAFQKVARPGDSGGAAFCKVDIGGTKYWMFAGPMIGGVNEKGVLYSLVYPMDVLSEKIGRVGVHLADRPGLW